MLTPYYQQDNITIYCGDCREIKPQLESHDLILTDPPYAAKSLGGNNFFSKGAANFYHSRELRDMNNFNLADYEDVLYPANMLIAFHDRNLIRDYSAFITRVYGNYDLHVWHKVNAIPFTNNTFKSDIEYISQGYISGRRNLAKGLPQHEMSKVYSSGIDTENLHPCQKPLPLIMKYIRILQPSSILDPFMGSGTTLVAAKRCGISAIGIEINEQYCEIAVKRLAQSVMPLGVI